MSTIHIRAATRKDLSAIELIEENCFPAERRESPRSLRRSLESPVQSAWLAVSGGETAGYAVFRHHPRSLRIFSLAVLPAFRGAGAGRKLVEKALAVAKQAGAESVTLEADQGNVILTGWYETFGFAAGQTLKDYYSPGCHAVRMRLVLQPALKGGRVCGRS